MVNVDWFSPGCFELAGFYVIKEREFFEDLHIDDQVAEIHDIMRQDVSLDAQMFATILD